MVKFVLHIRYLSKSFITKYDIFILKEILEFQKILRLTEEFKNNLESTIIFERIGNDTFNYTLKIHEYFFPFYVCNVSLALLLYYSLRLSIKTSSLLCIWSLTKDERE